MSGLIGPLESNNTMVKIGKLFKKSKGKGDEATESTIGFRGKIKGRASPANSPPHAEDTSPPPLIIDDAASKSVEVEETRDQPSPTPATEWDDLAERNSCASASDSANEQSFEEEESPSDDGSRCTDEDDNGLESYEEEDFFNDEEDTEEEYTNDDDDVTFDQENTTLGGSGTVATSVATPASQIKGKGVLKNERYYHKDVVLSSLEDGFNSLVIRAMYCVPQPKEDDHVVVKIEVS